MSESAETSPLVAIMDGGACTGFIIGRGVRLARAAYESRAKQKLPPIIAAHYERNGEVLENYGRGQLGTVS